MSMFKGLFKVMFRRKGLVVTMFVTPILSILIIYAMFSFGNGSVTKVGYFDEDNSKQSKYILEQLKQNKRYKLYQDLNKEVLDEYIQDQKLEVIIKIPKNFGKNIVLGKADKVNLTFNNIEATAWLKNDLNNIIDRLNTIGQVSKGNEKVFEDIFKDSNNTNIKISNNLLEDETIGKSIAYRALGILMIFLVSTTMVITEQIVDDKRIGISNKIKLANSNFYSYFISFFIIGLIIVMVEILIIQLGIFLLKINMGIHPLYYMLAILSFGLVSIAVSLMLGGLCKELFTAQTAINIFNAPFAMLAGAWWPVEIMPDFMQKISKFVPQNWTMSAVKAIQYGNNYNEYFKFIGMLLGLAFILYLMAAYFMGKNRN